ncbi:transcriptional repressor [Wenyingzhuangia sp. 1_MG-2023]|nr:transcriptional repressor [Wenyingzhuangia sp. 1_MG-2023]
MSREVLKQHSLRVTSHRCELLDCFRQSDKALTFAHLEKKIKNKIDRVSLYRMLYSFSEKNILYKIIDSKKEINYIFNHHLKKYTHHSYFKCKLCNNIIRLPLEYINSLKQYINVEELNILAEGTCNVCTKKE